MIEDNNICIRCSRNRNKFINQIRAPGGHIQLTNIMLSVNFVRNISSYDILAYITKNYIALIYYAKIVHLLCHFHAGKVGFSAVCRAIFS